MLLVEVLATLLATLLALTSVSWSVYLKAIESVEMTVTLTEMKWREQKKEMKMAVAFFCAFWIQHHGLNILEQLGSHSQGEKNVVVASSLPCQ